MPELVLFLTFFVYSIKTTKLECDQNKCGNKTNCIGVPADINSVVNGPGLD